MVVLFWSNDIGRAWEGKAARQQVDEDIPSNYHLEGGQDQLFVSFIDKQDPNFRNNILIEENQW